MASIERIESDDLRAIYSDAEQWETKPHHVGVKLALRIFNDICPDLLLPVDFSRVIQARKAISKIYCRGLHRPGERIDWREADTQCAYMLRFFLIHCQFIPELLGSTPNILTRLPEGNHLRVCCVGGGPGSDIIGLIAYLRSINRNTRLTCHVLDKFPEWMNVWKTIQPRLPPYSVNASYSYLDTTSAEPLDTMIKEVVSQADIITFVKSVSPIAAHLKSSHAFMFDPSQMGVIPSILRTLKSGALVIYIDNKQGEHNQIFSEMAVSAGLQNFHQTTIWTCDIEATVLEPPWWYAHCRQALLSCSLQGYIFYKP